jgi:hypothetical protein
MMWLTSYKGTLPFWMQQRKETWPV